MRDRLIIRDIGGMGLGAATRGADGGCRLLGRCLVAIDDDHPGTLAPHDPCPALADPRSGARHDRDLVFQNHTRLTLVLVAAPGAALVIRLLPCRHDHPSCGAGTAGRLPAWSGRTSSPWCRWR